MPFYEYLCEDCRQTFEDLRKVEERDAPGSCPECGSRRVKRGLSRFAAIVAGTAPCGSRASSCESPGGG